MAMFLSTHVNKVDRKGRVSVPAQFRAAVTGQSFQGVVLVRSPNLPALDGFAMDEMERLANDLNSGFEHYSEEQMFLAATLLGDATQAPFDGEGRIVLPGELATHCGVTEQAAFIGLGRKFQIWEPNALAAFKNQAAQQVRDRRLSVPNLSAKGSAGPMAAPGAGATA